MQDTSGAARAAEPFAWEAPIGRILRSFFDDAPGIRHFDIANAADVTLLAGVSDSVLLREWPAESGVLFLTHLAVVGSDLANTPFSVEVNGFPVVEGEDVSNRVSHGIGASLIDPLPFRLVVDLGPHRLQVRATNNAGVANTLRARFVGYFIVGWARDGSGRHG